MLRAAESIETVLSYSSGLDFIDLVSDNLLLFANLRSPSFHCVHSNLSFSHMMLCESARRSNRLIGAPRNRPGISLTHV